MRPGAAKRRGDGILTQVSKNYASVRAATSGRKRGRKLLGKILTLTFKER